MCILAFCQLRSLKCQNNELTQIKHKNAADHRQFMHDMAHVNPKIVPRLLIIIIILLGCLWFKKIYHPHLHPPPIFLLVAPPSSFLPPPRLFCMCPSPSTPCYGLWLLRPLPNCNSSVLISTPPTAPLHVPPTPSTCGSSTVTKWAINGNSKGKYYRLKLNSAEQVLRRSSQSGRNCAGKSIKSSKN